MTRGHRPSEFGLTVIELVAAVAVSGILMGVVASAFGLGLRTTDAAAVRMSDSAASHLAARYFVPDVQSGIWIDPATGDNGCSASGDVRAMFRMPASTGANLAVTYKLVAGELHRVSCDSLAGERTVRVGDGIASATIAEPVAGVVTLSVSTTSSLSWSVEATQRIGGGR